MTHEIWMALWAAKQYGLYKTVGSTRDEIREGVKQIENVFTPPPCDGTVHDSVCGCPGCNLPEEIDPPEQLSMF